MIGPHVVTVAAEDISCLVDEVAIVHGRSGPTGQPEASACTLDLSTLPGVEVPGALDVGAVLVVTTEGPDGTDSVRFTGHVTDINLGWDDAGTATPTAGVGQVTAVGVLADLGHRVVGDAPFPTEQDGPRVARVLGLAGVTFTPANIDPGTVQILARDIDTQPAQGVIASTAESAGGMLWQDRAGAVHYADAEHRRGITMALSLDACDVDVTPTWSRTTGGLINRVSLGYGVVPDGGEQPRYLAEDAASITARGLYAFTAETELAALADATEAGLLLLARAAAPVWNLSAVPTNLDHLSDADHNAALRLDVGDLVSLTGLPNISTVPTSVYLFVEGWSERLAFGEHTVDWYLSGYCRTVPPPRWDDISPDSTWDNLDPAMTWDGASCLGPPIDTGRWTDVAASLAWDEAGATQWDQWTKTPIGA